MHCSEAKLGLEGYVTGSASAAERTEIEDHVATCEACRLELELRRAIQSTPSALPTLALDEAPAPYPDLSLSPVESVPPLELTVPADAVAPGGPVVPADPAASVESANPVEPGPSAISDPEVSFADLTLDLPEPSMVPSPAAAPAPAATPALATLSPPVSPSAERPAGDRPSGPHEDADWGFEPIDVPRESVPPEGSRSFANQALARKREEALKGKNAIVRVALWGAGGVAGLALLGVSIWVAMAVREEPEGSAVPAGAPAVEMTVDSVGVEPMEAPESGAAATSRDPAPPTMSPDPQIPGAANPPAAGEPASPAPVVSSVPPSAPAVVPAAPSVAPKPEAPKLAPPPQPALEAKPAPQPVKRSTPTSMSASGTGGAAAPKPAKAPPPPTSKPAPPPTRSSTPVWPTDEPDGVAPDPVPDPEGTSEPVQAQPSAPAPGTPAARDTAAARAPAATGAPAATVAPSANTTTALSAAAASPPAVSDSARPASPAPAPPTPRPVDRLHTATQNAAAGGDLEALKKLKATWKSFIRTGGGSDRARAKREYADCLWAIQEITTREADQREALAAYREYVLHAPAGGTDARTVARMRYLEDVVSGSR